jgi:hypothetical protein
MNGSDMLNSIDWYSSQNIDFSENRYSALFKSRQFEGAMLLSFDTQLAFRLARILRNR